MSLATSEGKTRAQELQLSNIALIWSYIAPVLSGVAARLGPPASLFLRICGALFIWYGLILLIDLIYTFLMGTSG